MLNLWHACPEGTICTDGECWCSISSHTVLACVPLFAASKSRYKNNNCLKTCIIRRCPPTPTPPQANTATRLFSANQRFVGEESELWLVTLQSVCFMLSSSLFNFHLKVFLTLFFASLCSLALSHTKPTHTYRDTFFTVKIFINQLAGQLGKKLNQFLFLPQFVTP